MHSQVRQDVERLSAQGHGAPCLVVVLVGNHPASQSYVGKKLQAAASCGIAARVEAFDEAISEAELLAAVLRLNADDCVSAASS